MKQIEGQLTKNNPSTCQRAYSHSTQGHTGWGYFPKKPCVNFLPISLNGWDTARLLSIMLSFEMCSRCSSAATPAKYEFIGSNKYRQVSNIRRTKSQYLKDSRTVLRLSLPNPLLPVENEDVVGAAPVGDAPTTSEWSTIYCLLMCVLY